MRIGLRGAWEVITSVYNEVQRDRVLNIAAGLSYYFLLSLFPLLILLATLLGYLPIPNLFQQLMDLAARLVPRDAMGLVQRILKSVLTPNRTGLLSFGIAGTLWASSGGFSAMIDALDIAYDSRVTRSIIKQRLLAMALTFMTGALMALALLLTIGGGRIGLLIGKLLHLSDLFQIAWPYMRWSIIAAAIVLSLELLYFIGPNVKQKFRHTLPGAILGTLLWVLISIAVNAYVSQFAHYNKTYGAIGAVIALMLWMYVSSIAILIGAEFNSELLKAEGKRLAGQKTMPPDQPTRLPQAA